MDFSLLQNKHHALPVHKSYREDLLDVAIDFATGIGECFKRKRFLYSAATVCAFAVPVLACGPAGVVVLPSMAALGILGKAAKENMFYSSQEAVLESSRARQDRLIVEAKADIAVLINTGVTHASAPFLKLDRLREFRELEQDIQLSCRAIEARKQLTVLLSRDDARLPESFFLLRDIGADSYSRAKRQVEEEQQKALFITINLSKSFFTAARIEVARILTSPDEIKKFDPALQERMNRLMANNVSPS